MIMHKFYSHVNYSVTKIDKLAELEARPFYSHVNYSVTKIIKGIKKKVSMFYSHVNYSVTKISDIGLKMTALVLQSRKLFSY